MKDALKSSKLQVVRVEFDPPLLGYEEVKPRLLGMKADGTSKIRHLLPQLKSHTPTQHFTMCTILTCNNSVSGQGSANHAFRTPVPDLDHDIPPPPLDLHLCCPAARFGFACQVVLVARAYDLSRDLVYPFWVGDCCNRTHGRGRLRGHPRVQASHAMAYRSKLSLPHPCNSDDDGGCTALRARPSRSSPCLTIYLITPPQTAWVGTATVFGFPVLMGLRRLIKQARIESIMKGH